MFLKITNFYLIYYLYLPTHVANVFTRKQSYKLELKNIYKYLYYYFNTASKVFTTLAACT